MNLQTQWQFFLCLLFLLFITCAKKALPPSPDRFAPHLLEISAVNRTKINLVFDEPIDIAQINSQSFTITSLAGETLLIKTVTGSKKSDIISLFTMPQKSEKYLISGVVQDHYQNVTRLNKRFEASSAIDSVPPRIIDIAPTPGTTNKVNDITIAINFSEPMDTNQPIRYFIYPLLKEKMRMSWKFDWTTLYFSYSESLLPNTTVYFLLYPMLIDLEGNALSEIGYTFFTRDTFLAPLTISGKLFYNNKPVQNGIILFTAQFKTSVSELSVSDFNATYSARLHPNIYTLFAIADTNFDGQIDLSTPFTQRLDLSGQLSDSIFDSLKKFDINLVPILEKKSLDDYLH